MKPHRDTPKYLFVSEDGEVILSDETFPILTAQESAETGCFRYVSPTELTFSDSLILSVTMLLFVALFVMLSKKGK